MSELLRPAKLIAHKAYKKRASKIAGQEVRLIPLG